MIGGKPERYLMADGIHLNDLGHDLYVELAGPILMDAIAALPRRAG